MIIEIGDNGLRSHYHYTSYEIDDATATSPAEAAYQAIRLQYPFLTDDNHTWQAVDYGPTRPGVSKHLIALQKLTDSSRYNITINHTNPSGWSGLLYWFSVAYRVPGELY